MAIPQVHRRVLGRVLIGLALSAASPRPAEARAPTRDVLDVPLTPGAGPEPYVAMVAFPGAGATSWKADAEHFACVGSGDWLQLELDPASWPSAMPSKVKCYGDNGKKATIPVTVAAEPHVSMLVADGTLVMPRTKGSSAIYEGAPPREDLVAQQGRTEGLELTCAIAAGARLRVVVNPDEGDGDGACVLRTRFGEDVRLSIRVVTLK